MILRLVFLFVIFCCTSSYSIAGNNPCSATTLSTDMLVFETVSIGISSSPVEDPSCGDYHGGDEWFSFIVPAGGDVAIQLLEGSITNAAFALYSGNCNDLEEIQCVDDYLCGSEPMPAWYFENLTPGATYYLRIWNEDGPVPGNVQIRISHPSGNPYETIGSATNISFEGYSNCIQLTAAVPGQAGCAWYPVQVDFSQPFEHHFNMYFGTIQGQAGADGMAIIYQINGISVCGQPGAGIGYQGIGSSWGIEFDTYQNGPPYIDPVEDHTAISINGDLSFHPSGPVTLGYISDGEFHDVVVSWEPTTQLFRVWFDGVLVHDLNYDIVNQVFGGQTMAWWGVSASTGGAVNQHVLCFDDVEIENLANVYTQVELTVCEEEPVFLEGDFQTETGVYVDYFTAFNGCDSIVTTNLMHFPSSDPITLQEVICPGEVYFFNGIQVTEEGLYEAFLTDQYGCDSLVLLQAVVPHFEVYLEQNGPLNCNLESVTIEAFIETDADEVIIDWVSFGGNITSGQSTQQIQVNQAGVYIAEIFLEKNGTLCGPYFAEIQVDEFYIHPFGEIQIIGDLGCNDETVILNAGNIFNADEYNWTTVEGNIIDQPNLWSIEVNSSGLYVLELINSFSGCITILEVEVDPPPGAPEAGIVVVDTAACGNPISILSAVGSSMGEHIVYHWSVEQGEIIGDSSGFNIELFNGEHAFLTVTDTSNNCRSILTLSLPFIENFPDFNLNISGEFNCLTDEVEITVNSNGLIAGDLFFTWTFENEGIKTDTGATILLVEEPGWYLLEVSEITGRCLFIDSIQVFDNFERSEVEINHPGDIDCLTDSLLLTATLSLPDSILNFQWSGPDGNPIQEQANELFISEPGLYILEVIHKNSGCLSKDSIQITDNRELPEWEMANSITLNCNEQSIEIVPEILFPINEDDLSYGWFLDGDDDPFSDQKSQVFDTPGNYFLIVKNERNNCESVQHLNIELDTIPPIFEVHSPLLLNCENQEAIIEITDLSSSEGIIYSWSNADGEELQSGVRKQLEISEAGWYFILAENPENHCTSQDSVWVDEDFSVPSGILTTEPELINCINREVALIFMPDQENDSLKLNWTLADGSNITQTAFPYVITTDMGGWIQIEVINPVSKCTFNTAIEIQAFLNQPLIQLDLSGETINCEIEEIQAFFNINGIHENLQVTLNNSEGEETVFFTAQGEFQIFQSGDFQLLVIDTLSLCEDYIQFEVGEDRTYPELNFLPFDHLSCSNPEMTLEVEGDFDQSEDYRIDWFRDGQQLNGISDLLYITDLPGLYTVSVKNMKNGCEAVTNMELLYLGTPITSVELSKREVDCNGKNGAIFVEKIEGGTQPINWFVNNEQVEDGAIIEPLSYGEYELLWVDSLGCQWTEKLLLPEPLQLKAQIPPLYQIEEGSAVELRPEINKDESNLVSIVWEPELFLDCSWCLYPVSKPDYSIDYQLWLFDNIGCEQLITTRVEVKISRDVYIPNAFSPGNRDGVNDYFFPLSREGRIAEITLFQVFDRWGEKVFSVANIPSDKEENGWDGTFSGELLNPGIFIYLLKIEWADGETTIHSGEVNLIH
ncbi:MAG: hypothetical protein EA362_12185 [Saprospirales bacterium]|nr:MAG: hypothetical protein EA362_12185 [Saprospirales bacterium]